jgi:hypothetical protein
MSTPGESSDRYDKWKFDITKLARMNGCKCLIDDSGSKPSTYTSSQWTENDDIFLGVLISTLDDAVQMSLQSELTTISSSLAFIAHMEATYKSSSVSSKYTLLVQLMGVKQNGRHISIYLNEIRKIKSTMSAMDFKLDDMYSIIALSKLDTQYETVRQIILQEDKIPSIDQLQAKLLTSITPLFVLFRKCECSI